MPKFGAEVTHQLGKSEAKIRLQAFSDEIRQEYAGQLTDMSESWNDAGNLEFSFKVLGMKIDGEMVIEEEKVIVDGNLPIAAVAFKGKIESDIRTQLESILT